MQRAEAHHGPSHRPQVHPGGEGTGQPYLLGCIARCRSRGHRIPRASRPAAPHLHTPPQCLGAGRTRGALQGPQSGLYVRLPRATHAALSPCPCPLLPGPVPALPLLLLIWEPPLLVGGAQCLSWKEPGKCLPANHRFPWTAFSPGARCSGPCLKPPTHPGSRQRNLSFAGGGIGHVGLAT